MEFIKKVIRYLSANPALTFVLIGCCVFIAVIVVVICVLAAKANKAKQALTESQSVTIDAEQKSEELKQPIIEKTLENEIELTPAPVDLEEPTPTVSLEKTEELETVSLEKEEKTTVKKLTPPSPKSTNVSRTAQKEKPKKTTTTIEEPKENATVITKQPEIVEPIKEEKAETVKKAQSSRYNGKWAICHLITKDENLGENNTEETYFFELHASNGEKLLSSEEYTSYNGALKGIETHKTNILKNNFRVGLSKKGDYIFKLLSGKNTLLCTGENYPTKLRCEKAIESTKRFAQTAIIDENTHDILVNIPLDTEDDVVEYDQTILGKWIISKTVALDGDEIYYFELFASNGEKLLSSEEYTSYTGALNGISTHKNNIEKDNFRIALTKRGDYIYKLLTGNGQLLCLGEHYKTRRRCENAVESVKRFAKSSPILTAANVAPKE
jgi:uncharacterized protein YegP (UPF0339 family)